MPAAKRSRTRGSDALDLLLAQKNGKRGEIAKRLREQVDRSILNRARIGERQPSRTTAEKIRGITAGLIPASWWDEPARGPKRCPKCGRACECCGRAA
jgi:hypothetical protein